MNTYHREKQSKNEKDNKYKQWIEEIKKDTLEQTEFIQSIYTGTTSRKLTPLERSSEKSRKKFFQTPEKIFLYPKVSSEYQSKKFSKAKNDFLHNYQSNFKGDGKININEDPRALNILLFHQLNASGLASRRWSSVHAYRSCLNSQALAPEFE